MDSGGASSHDDETEEKEPAQFSQRAAPELTRLLMGMVLALDEVRNSLSSFLTKVKEGELSTKGGISYLEAKHFLLMFYCQCIVFYIVLKAEGRSVQNHPVIAKLIEIRLFLEKIRPIDKKLHYQVEKLLKLATGLPYMTGGKETDMQSNQEDALMYRPNPEMLVSKIDSTNKETSGLYRPPMIAPTAMDDEKNLKQKGLESRIQKDALRKASRSSFIKDLANDLEGRPEEVKEMVGSESREMTRQLVRLEARAKQEEDIFSRVPLSRVEKKKLKHLKRSRNGLLGMLDRFDDDVTSLLEMENRPFSGTAREPEDLSYPSKKLKSSKKTATFKRQKAVLTKKKFGQKTKGPIKR